jgi:aryl-alcohol dehydrogenase-like predicted oxidoreductase
MMRRQLGRTDLEVTPWCLGCNVIGNTLDEAHSMAVLDAYVEAGGNFIDTANIYGAGQSETIIGLWMKQRRNRDSLVLATKIGWPAKPPVSEEGLSERSIRNGLESSLRRLGTDHVDLYYAHCDDTAVPLEVSLRSFAALRSQGKIRWIAASNYVPDRLNDALEASEDLGLNRFECLQAKYNLVDRADFEGGLAAVCATRNVAVTTYFSLARGFLTGKYLRGAELPDSPRVGAVTANYFNDASFDTLDRVRTTATSIGATPAQVSLAWLLRKPEVASCVSAAMSPAQVTELAGATQIHLSADDDRFLSDDSNPQVQRTKTSG